MGTFSSMFLGRLRGIQDHFLIVIQCYLKLVSTYHQNHLPCCQWSMSTLGSIYGTQASPLIGANKTPEGKVPCPRLWSEPGRCLLTVPRASPLRCSQAASLCGSPSLDGRSVCCGGVFLVGGAYSAHVLWAGRKSWIINIPRSSSQPVTNRN